MRSNEELSLKNDELAQKKADEIINIFKNIKKSLNSRLKESAKQYGFTDTQLSVIFNLYKEPSITLNELSDYMGLTKSTVSGIVERLVKQGVITREVPENNRRIVKLSISEEFKKNNDICNMRRKFISNLISNSIKDIDLMEIEEMISGLRKFDSLLNDNE